MSEYFMRVIQPGDYKRVAEIYNSNYLFLRNHLGVEAIDEGFIEEEVLTMRRIGFCSCVIVSKEEKTVQGILDYRPGKEVYLSLLMLTAQLQGKGLGRRIYDSFEKSMKQSGSSSIRIDVLDHDPGNLVSYWKMLGFSGNETVTLKWGRKISRAVVMRKKIP